LGRRTLAEWRRNAGGALGAPGVLQESLASGRLVLALGLSKIVPDVGRIVREILAHHLTTIRPCRESSRNAGKSANFARSTKLLFHVFYVLQQ